MKWKKPPVIKIYEALGAIGDGRVEVSGDTAKVYSSSRGKFYDVRYDPAKNAITANDNGSFYQGYLGYPSIAFLLARGIIAFDSHWAKALHGFVWKDLNVKFKNDWDKTEDHIRESLATRGEDLTKLSEELERIESELLKMDLESLPSETKPPKAY